jgi:GNAT superfamily N-acetyltransferase
VITEGLKKLFSSKAYGNFWLIYDDEIVVGYIIIVHGFSLEYHGVDAMIDEFFIRESYRGKGIGTQTLQFIEDELSRQGIKAFHLEVNHRNNSAKKMYSRFGFKDHDRYLMTKWIKK